MHVCVPAFNRTIVECLMCVYNALAIWSRFRVVDVSFVESNQKNTVRLAAPVALLASMIEKCK